jgi:TRAP-type mannitol/chloroaromatic compound transport system permease small subunit
MTLNYSQGSSPLSIIYKETAAKERYIIFLIRILFFFIPAVAGMINIFIKTMKEYLVRAKKENSFFRGFKILTFNESQSISTFFLILFFSCFFLFLLKLLPFGVYRANYFLLPMVGYFWLEGFSVFKKSKKKLFYVFGNISLFFAIISLVVFIGVGYTKEAFNKPGFSYDTVGKAITYAYKTNAVIIIPEKMEEDRFRMIIHSYSNDKNELNVTTANKIKNMCKDTQAGKNPFIVFERNSYKIMSLRELCHVYGL